MSLTDYEKRGSGSITPSAALSTAMSADGSPVNIVLSNYTSATGALPEAGWGVMIDGEILRVNSVTMPLINVSRGCADTVPSRHAYGTKVWFFTAGYGTDDRQYAATINLGVKVLMKSTASAMEPKNAPPIGLTFNQRFARPYPPGKFLVNGVSFSDLTLLVNDTPGTDAIDFTWAHRDRITQGDTLQGHEIGNIGPEVGTTYSIKAYKPDGTLVKTFAAITGTSLNYPIADIRSDFEVTDTPIYDARFTLESERDGFTSWQKYTVLVDIMAEAAEPAYTTGAYTINSQNSDLSLVDQPMSLTAKAHIDSLLVAAHGSGLSCAAIQGEAANLVAFNSTVLMPGTVIDLLDIAISWTAPGAAGVSLGVSLDGEDVGWLSKTDVDGFENNLTVSSVITVGNEPGQIKQVVMSTIGTSGDAQPIYSLAIASGALTAVNPVPYVAEIIPACAV